MEYLNCEGCQYLSDDAFKYLLMSTNYIEKDQNHSLKTPINNVNAVNCSSHCLNRNQCFDFVDKNDSNNNLEEMFNSNNKQSLISKNNGSLNLKYINLSGCWLITDFGLG